LDGSGGNDNAAGLITTLKSFIRKAHEFEERLAFQG
jgi:hypothetical protein